MFKRLRSAKKVIKDEVASKQPGRKPEASLPTRPQSGRDTTVPRPPTQHTSESLCVSQAPDSIGRRSNRPEPQLDFLGLHVLHSPELCAIDIVFVHGLGGHSHRTWTKDNDPYLFWPKSWLPFEPDMGVARILTFGYNASWRGPAKSISSIADFAKDLLYELRFGHDDDGNDLNIGGRPIIFVVHSMGGLVVKKAYLLGLYDANYKHIIDSVSAVIFLSTPHRGTNLAETLNRVITATFQSSKTFISDLDKSSIILEELNEQFRHIAPGLSIWSFYETIASTIGPKKLMVLEKDSSILGYPNEISKPLNADHQNICKFSSPGDSNYISVRNAIKSLVSMFRSTSQRRIQEGQISLENTKVEETLNLKELFGDCVTSEDDYSSLRRSWIPETCEWFLQQTEVHYWMDPLQQPSVSWYNAPPASGKSVLAAFVVNQMRDAGKQCQYFLFNHTDQRKTSAASGLKALAVQMAKDIPEFRQKLSLQTPDNISIESEDPQLIWRNLFDNVLSNTNVDGPLYWVIDALDECNAPKLFLDCLKGLSQLAVPIRVLVLSRNTDAISVAFDRLSRSLRVERVEIEGHEHNQADIKHLIEQEIDHMRGSLDFRNDLKERILKRSAGNFLWTKLVLDEILDCHTEESIQEVFEDIPDDIFELYQRMEDNLVKSTRRSNLLLIKALLEWSACSHRSLNLQELSQALQPEFSRILDLKRTIEDTCGQFIQIDSRGKVGMLHHTAREYFLRNSESQFFINEGESHERLFFKTLSVLEEPSLQVDLLQQQHALQSTRPFIFYSAVSWPYHLGKGEKIEQDYSIERLSQFLRGPAILVWIHALSLLRRTDVLVKASKVIVSLANQTRKRNASRNPMLHRLSDLQLLEEWADDLTKIVGKFGGNLLVSPSIVYDIMPSLCPGQTAIAKQVRGFTSTRLQVLGLESFKWNDNLARLALPSNTQAWGLSCSGKILAVLGSTGVVQLWDSSSFTKVGFVESPESVSAIALNQTGTKLLTYGIDNTKVWSVPSGKPLFSVLNPNLTNAMDICFTKNDESILMGGDDKGIRFVLCAEPEKGWQLIHPNTLLKERVIDGNFTSSPMCLAFNSDRSLLAASYRGAPLSVWRVSDGSCINKCKRAKDFSTGERRPSANWFGVDRFTWNPVTSHILGVYRDGCVFKWHPLTDEVIETHKGADEIASSPNGKLFATSSSDGAVRVWDFAHFTVIYQLSSDDLVTGLCFSPNSRRIYDIRAGVVNVWEPDSVVRFNENETRLSDTNSETQSSISLSKYSEDRITSFEAITSIAVSPNKNAYCVGYEDGGVLLFSNDEEEGIELLRFYNFLDVNQITWSPNGKYVAATDLAGEVQIASITAGDGTPAIAVESLTQPQVELDGASISEILFSPESSMLLITTNKDCLKYSIRESSIIQTLSSDDESNHQWFCHPKITNTVSACSSKDIRTYNVEDLTIQDIFHLNPPGSENSDSSETIGRVLVCQDTKHVIIHTASAASSSSSGAGFMLLHLNSFMKHQLEGPIDRITMPSEVEKEVYRPLGVLPGSRFIFLNHELWLCAYSLGTSTDSNELYQRFYFIPRDWVGSKSADICVFDSGGTLYWPRDDRVVRIKCNLDLARSVPIL